MKIKFTSTETILLSLFIILTLAFVSCDTNDYEYTLTYEVYWNSNTVEKKTIKSKDYISVESYEGTNSITTYEQGRIVSTTAPIRVISYTKKQINNDQRR